MQFGPTIRTGRLPRRAAANSRASRSRPSSVPASEKPDVNSAAALTPLSAHSPMTSIDVSLSTTSIARSGVSGSDEIEG